MTRTLTALRRKSWRHVRRLAWLGIAASLVAALPAWAFSSFTEDFTNTTYKDSVNTTADWNTTDGELRLHPALSLLGSVDTPDIANDVFVSGDHAYIADGSSGLQVIDISDPENPTLMGTLNTPHLAEGIFVDGDHAFVADHNTGLIVIDVTDPTSPATLGTVNTPGTALGVFVTGDYAYVADGLNGLQVVDVSDPATPSIIGTVDTPNNARKVWVDGDHAFVADYSSGLQIVDISDPTGPAILGAVDTPGQAQSVVVDGDHAFVADGSGGLQVVDVSDPTSPTIIGSLATPGQVEGVSVTGDRLYLADRAGGFLVVDITDPANPVLLQSIGTPDFAREVMVAGEEAYVAQNTAGLQVVRVNLIQTPTPVGSVDTPGIASQVVVAGDYAYVADQTNGLRVINIEDPTSPTSAGSYDTPGESWDVALAGDYAFVPDAAGGLQVIDIGDPAHPTFAGSCNEPGLELGVAVAGDYAFVAADLYGLQVIDIHDPTNPTLAGTIDTPSEAWRVAVAGDYAFVADGSAGLEVIDIHDPRHPTLAGSLGTPGDATGVTVSGDQVLVCNQSASVQVIDVSDPMNPALLASYHTPGSAWRVTAAGDVAFVVEGNLGMEVLRTRQSEIDTERNIGQSLAVDGGTDIIPRARLTATQTGNVSWQLSADGGTNWSALMPDGAWLRFAGPQSDLRWRTTLAWTPGNDPIVSDLTVDWLNEFGPITSVSDVPDDQGHWVNLQFARSAYDFPDETTYPIVGYAIYLRIDDQARVREVMGQGTTPATESLNNTPYASYGADRVRTLSGQTFVLGRDMAEGSGFPPGVWQGVGWILPTQSDSYQTRVATPADSSSSGTPWAVYFTATHTSTPSIWFASEPDSGYSVDNIPPAVPQSLVFESPNVLQWDAAPEPDFEYYTVYGSTTGDFGSATFLGYTGDPTYDVSGSPFGYYHVTASDHAGNESGDARIENATLSAPQTDLPLSFALKAAHPNPLRSSTMVDFDLPAPVSVTLRIVDLAGRQVRVVLDGQLSAGRHAVSWDGRDQKGTQVAPGVYFARLEAGAFRGTQRLVLIR